MRTFETRAATVALALKEICDDPRLIFRAVELLEHAIDEFDQREIDCLALIASTARLRRKISKQLYEG